MRGWIGALAVVGCGEVDPEPREPQEPVPPAPLVCPLPEALDGPQAALCFQGEPVRCGGDPTGTWTANSRCEASGGTSIGADPTTTLVDYVCPGDRLTTQTSDTETLTLGDDGRFTWVVDTTAVETWAVPSSCLASLEVGDCAALGDRYRYPCTDTPEGCSCVVSTTGFHQDLAGAWETCEAGLVLIPSGGAITTTTAGGAPVPQAVPPGQGSFYPFCADGDTLRLFSSTVAGLSTGYVRR